MSIADVLGPLTAPAPQAPKHSGAQAPKRPSPQAPKHLPLQGTAKSTHPDFAPVKVYLRKATRRDAERRFEDAGGGDLSDLVEQLLREYADGGRRG